MSVEYRIGVVGPTTPEIELKLEEMQAFLKISMVVEQFDPLKTYKAILVTDNTSKEQLQMLENLGIRPIYVLPEEKAPNIALYQSVKNLDLALLSFTEDTHFLRVKTNESIKRLISFATLITHLTHLGGNPEKDSHLYELYKSLVELDKAMHISISKNPDSIRRKVPGSEFEGGIELIIANGEHSDRNSFVRKEIRSDERSFDSTHAELALGEYQLSFLLRPRFRIANYMYPIRHEEYTTLLQELIRGPNALQLEAMFIDEKTSPELVGKINTLLRESAYRATTAIVLGAQRYMKKPSLDEMITMMRNRYTAKYGIPADLVECLITQAKLDEQQIIPYANRSKRNIIIDVGTENFDVNTVGQRLGVITRENSPVLPGLLQESPRDNIVHVDMTPLWATLPEILYDLAITWGITAKDQFLRDINLSNLSEAPSLENIGLLRALAKFKIAARGRASLNQDERNYYRQEFTYRHDLCRQLAAKLGVDVTKYLQSSMQNPGTNQASLDLPDQSRF